MAGAKLPAALFLSFLCLYTLTAFPGPGGRINYGDSVWKQTIPVSGCTPHVTGFPQYILLSKLFNHLPSQVPLFRSAAYRVTSISVLFGALTVLMLYVIAAEIGLGKRAAALSASVYGVSYHFWTQATEAEVYTLNSFLFASVICLFLRYRRTGRQAFLLAGSLLYALSFGNHLTMILLLPGLLFLTWDRDPAVFRNPKLIGWALGCVLLSLFQYVYLHQSFFSGMGLNEFLDFVTGAGCKGDVFQFQLGRLRQEIPRTVVLMEKQFTLLGLAVAGLGAFNLYQASKKILAFFLIIFFSYLIFSLGYRIGDIEVYYLPAYLVMAVFLGYGLGSNHEGHEGHEGRRGGARVRAWAALLASAVILIWQVSLNVFARDIVVRENPYLANLLEFVHQTPEGSTLLLTTEPEWQAGFYYTQLANYISYSGEFGDLRIEPPQNWPRCPPLPAGPAYRIATNPGSLQSEQMFYLRRSDGQRVMSSHSLALHWKAADPQSDILVARRLK